MGRTRVSAGGVETFMRAFVYWFLRIFLGSLFIFSCIHKIADPYGFALIVRNYQLTPLYLINFVAIVLPYVELLCGLMILFGVWRLGALFLVELMLAFFSVLIAVNILRGIDFTCGCFSNSPQKVFMELPMVALVRDIILMAMGGYLFKLEQPYFKKYYIRSIAQTNREA